VSEENGDFYVTDDETETGSAAYEATPVLMLALLTRMSTPLSLQLGVQTLSSVREQPSSSTGLLPP